MLRHISTVVEGLQSLVSTHVREAQDGRGPVQYALILVLIAVVVITFVKTLQGAWFSFR
jgi:Flp pilus assembly pilin Flp